MEAVLLGLKFLIYRNPGFSPLLFIKNYIITSLNKHVHSYGVYGVHHATRRKTRRSGVISFDPALYTIHETTRNRARRGINTYREMESVNRAFPSTGRRLNFSSTFFGRGRNEITKYVYTYVYLGPENKSDTQERGRGDRREEKRREVENRAAAVCRARVTRRNFFPIR